MAQLGQEVAYAHVQSYYVIGFEKCIKDTIDVINKNKPSYYEKNKEFINSIDEVNITMIVSDFEQLPIEEFGEGIDPKALGAEKAFILFL